MSADWSDKLYDENRRLRDQVKRQRRVIAEHRYMIHLLWVRSRNDWRIVGEGKHRHVNDGRGATYGPVSSIAGKTLISAPRMAQIVTDAIRERKRDGL
jgi:hypothetical protein